MGVGKIKYGSDILGYIKLLEVNKKITDADLVILRAFAYILSITMKTGHMNKAISNSQVNSLLSSIVSGRLSGEEKISKQAKHLEISLKPNLYVFCVDIRDKNRVISKSNRELYIYIFQESFNREHFLLYDNMLVILVDTDKSKKQLDEIIDSFKVSLEKNDLILGCSSCFRNLSDMKTYYEQACKAISVARRGELSGNIFYYDALVIDDMLDTFAAYDNIKVLLHPAILTLGEVGEINNNEFLTTLREYLHTSRDISKTARNLHVHYNTVKYRIGKIVEMTGIDFNDYELMLRLQLSFKALEIIKRD